MPAVRIEGAPVIRSLRLTPIPPLARALAAASPRLSRPSTPVASLAIHGAALTLFLAACACALFASGLVAWAPGLVYVGYDLILVAIVVAATRRQAVTPPTVGAQSTLTAVLAAHNEARALPATLRALLAQSDAPDLVFIADDGSRDDTAVVLARAFGLTPPQPGGIGTSATHPTLRWLRLPHGGKARALNAALLVAETDIVLTIDADTLLEAGAVSAFRAAFATDPRLVAAGGQLKPTCDATWLGRLLQALQRREYARNALTFAAWAQLDALLHIPGALAGFRRDALLAVGGFDPDGLVEDYELIHRLRRHAALHDLDWSTGIVAAHATTDAPATVPAFLRQRQRWFCGFLETQLWYRDMVGAARYGRVGRLMLPIKAFDTLQPLHGLVALLLLPVLAVREHWGVLAAAGIFLGVKIALDVVVHARAARLNFGGVGTSFGLVPLTAAVLGGFSFEFLRHLGAALGWIAFLTGDRAWRPQARAGLVAARDTDAA